MDKAEKRLAELDSALAEALSAEELLNLRSGILLREWIAKRIEILINKITGTSFEQNHDGYLKALGELNGLRDLDRKIVRYSDPVVGDKIRAERDLVKETIDQNG